MPFGTFPGLGPGLTFQPGATTKFFEPLADGEIQPGGGGPEGGAAAQVAKKPPPYLWIAAGVAVVAAIVLLGKKR